ncbi:eukaryotic integral membrane protein-domain-containing protein [Nemania sp. NC0429]|nr:eukaryotic integral membrane protein-domain-containing protein [Nemania sp. NC0429]
MPPRLNIPPVTRIVLAALGLQSLSSIIIHRGRSNVVIEWLTLVPQLSLFYPWTFLTTALVEENLTSLIIAGVTLFNGGRYLERAWSSKEFAKFLVVASLVPNFLCFLLLITMFTFTRNEDWTLTTINGTIPLQISFLVAFSQLVPAHTVTLFRGILSLRVPRFPLIYLGLIVAANLTPWISSASLPLAIFGFLTSWTYLRFYKTVFPDLDSSSQPASMRGDASETFAFSEFFPAPVKPFIAAMADQVFNMLVAMRVCTPFSQADISAAQGSNLHQRSAPSGVRAEAERRRALALKVLDQRLHAATSSPATRSQPTPPPQTSGPTVQTQPHPNVQAAMTSEPGTMLGETHYNPDHDNGDKEHS